MRCRPIKYTTSMTIEAGWTPAKEMAGVRAVRRGMQSRTISSAACTKFSRDAAACSKLALR